MDLREAAGTKREHLVFMDFYDFIQKFVNTEAKNRKIVLKELEKIHAELTKHETEADRNV